jgi:hypothetical protein
MRTVVPETDAPVVFIRRFRNHENSATLALKSGEATMVDQAEISDVGIAVMCDIARASGLNLDSNKQAVLDKLVADGLVEVSKPARPEEDTKFAVTPLGQHLLDGRGVGVNES